MSVLPSDGKLVFAMKGMEPKDASGMTYLYMDSEGYDLYELGGVTSTSGSLVVIPYAEGDASIKISANKFTTASESCHVTSGSILVYANADGTGSGTRLAAPYGFKVYGDNLIAGQKARLTFYLSVPDAENVKVGDIAATRYGSGTANSITVGGVTYYPYRTSENAYTAPSQDSNNDNNTDALNDNLTVYINGNEPVGSVKVPVYGLEITTGIKSPGDENQKVYNTTNGTGWYVIANISQSNTHLSYNGTNIVGTADSTPCDYNALFGLNYNNSNKASVKVAVPSRSGTNTYYINGYNANPLTMNTTGTSYTMDGSGYELTFSYAYTSGKKTTTYYWRQTAADGNLRSSNSSTNHEFYVNKVTFVVPPAL